MGVAVRRHAQGQGAARHVTMSCSLTLVSEYVVRVGNVLSDL